MIRALSAPTGRRMSASKTHSPGTMLTFRPPRIVPMLSVTLGMIPAAPSPIARSVASTPSIWARMRLSGRSNSRSSRASKSRIKRAAMRVAEGLAWV